MSDSHDYIPTIEANLLPFAKTLYEYAMMSFTRWGVPSPQLLLEAAIDAFESAFISCQRPNHGKVDRLVKNEAKDALVHALRTYVQGYIARNPLVTDEDREQMNLPLYDTTPTPHPVPEVRPETEVLPMGKGAHKVTAVNPQTQNKKRPPLVSAVAYARRVRRADEPVSRAEDMPSDSQTGTSRTFQYTEADYGKVADYATAYENSTGHRGHWSNVTSLLISG
ncbi:MAG: hypothetical protein LBD08_00170 [Treponema sp.]|jgi:hypothetical protein|nr:hypothetical protein [Treponema sp.]